MLGPVGFAGGAFSCRDHTGNAGGVGEKPRVGRQSPVYGESMRSEGRTGQKSARAARRLAKAHPASS